MNVRSEERVKLRSLLLTRLDAGSVGRQQLAPVQVEAPAQQYELAERGAKRRAIVAPEIGDGLEGRFQSRQQPDDLDVAMTLRLQPPARSDPVQIAVDVELQKVAPWIPERSATGLREADLNVLSELGNQGLEWRLEPEAFSHLIDDRSLMVSREALARRGRRRLWRRVR